MRCTVASCALFTAPPPLGNEYTPPAAPFPTYGPKLGYVANGRLHPMCLTDVGANLLLDKAPNRSGNEQDVRITQGRQSKEWSRTVRRDALVAAPA